MNTGKIITELRNEKGLYQKELAAHLKVSTGTISNYEKGHHAPDLETLCRIADFFGVTTDYLLGRTGYRYDPKKLSRPISMDYTMSDVINTFLELSPQSASKAIDYAKLLIRAQASEDA